MTLTESSIRKIIAPSWFDISDEGNGEFIIDTRDHGDVGSETAGLTDIREARRIAKALRAVSPEIKVVADVCDEWVTVTVHTSK